jgi:small subunit ribosomal protein S9
VFLRSGEGSITVNGRAVGEYFHELGLEQAVGQPLDVTDTRSRYDVIVTVKGGGPTGQAEAVRHGVARALAQADESNSTSLRANGFLTRDPRMVERKKYGQRGARRRFQFSKR